MIPICTSFKSTRSPSFTQPQSLVVPALRWILAFKTVKVVNVKTGGKKDFLSCLSGGPPKQPPGFESGAQPASSFYLCSQRSVFYFLAEKGWGSAWNTLVFGTVKGYYLGSHSFPLGSWSSNNLIFSVQLLAHMNLVLSWCLRTLLQNKYEMQITYLNYNAIIFLFLVNINLLLYYNHILSHTE